MARPYYTSVQVCFDCKYRHVGCHAECEVYKDAKQKAEEEKQKIREIKKEEFIGYSGNKARKKEAIRRWCQRYGV